MKIDKSKRIEQKSTKKLQIKISFNQLRSAWIQKSGIFNFHGRIVGHTIDCVATIRRFFQKMGIRTFCTVWWGANQANVQLNGKKMNYNPMQCIWPYPLSSLVSKFWSTFCYSSCTRFRCFEWFCWYCCTAIWHIGTVRFCYSLVS